MTPAEQTLATNLARRIAMCRDRFEATGEDRWLVAADKTDDAYRRLVART